jgi:MFS family permease
MGSAVGGLMSTGMFLLVRQLPEDDFVSWGWRVPFLISIVLVFVGLFIRLRIMESPIFAQIKETRRLAKMPAADLLRSDSRNVLLAAGMYMAHGTLLRHDRLTRWPIRPACTGFTQNTYLIGVTAAIQCLTIPMYGALPDQRGSGASVITSARYSSSRSRSRSTS